MATQDTIGALDERAARGSAFPLVKVLAVLALAAFIALYLVYIRAQHVSLFHEAEFLHIPFLRALVSHTLSWEAVLTRFGEHLFPGYNALLAVNYYLFDISGAFDTGIFTLVLIASALLVAHKLFLSRAEFGFAELLGVLLVGLILLSPTNNTMFSMALAASVGTFLFVLAAYLLDSAISDRRPILLLAVYVLVPAAILLFLGGYSIGFIAALLGVSAIWIIRFPQDWPKATILAAVTVVAAVIYTAIIYRGIVPPPAKSLIANADLIARFALVMTASSVLGRAVNEATGSMTAYYVCGVALVVLSVAAAWHFARRNEKGSLFCLMLIIYSGINIAVVTYARFANGTDGAMGQWYNSHTHFLPVAVLYYVYLRLREVPRYAAALELTLMGFVVVAGAAAGYWHDWKKAPYAAEWKRIIQFQVPGVLAFEDQIVNKKDQFQTLLWDLAAAKAGMTFLYQNHLWVFRRNPATFAIPPDNWLTAAHNATIICPYGSKQVQFRLYRPPGWAASVIQVRTPAATQDVAVRNELVRIELSPHLAAVLLSAKDLEKSKPVVSASDPRPLAAVVGEISCGAGPG